nr:tyrosine-type recombinase/integrase [Desulfotomaculaceae bacterium]
LYAGLRVGEVSRIRRDDVEISERKGRVVVRVGKGMKRREVPLGAEARAMVRPWVSIKEWLFPGRYSGHLSTRAAQDVVKKYAYQARLEEVTPHVLRHTFATRLLRSGVDIVLVAALLGHARLDTTARYTRPGWVDLENAVE